MKEFFKCSILTELFNSRNEAFERNIMKNSEEHKELINGIENKMKNLLNYIPSEHYKFVSKEIDDVLFKVLLLSNFWNEEFYKLGVTDGMNLDNELKEKLEEIRNGKSEESNG